MVVSAGGSQYGFGGPPAFAASYLNMGNNCCRMKPQPSHSVNNHAVGGDVVVSPDAIQFQEPRNRLPIPVPQDKGMTGENKGPL